MTHPQTARSGPDAPPDQPLQQQPTAPGPVAPPVPQDLRVAGRRDRHRAGVVQRRGFARGPLPVSVFIATTALVAWAAHITGSGVAALLLGVIVGPGAWATAVYAGAFMTTRAWMLTTPGGVAVLQLKKNGTIHTFAAWPRGRGIGDQFLQRVTTEADRAGSGLHLSCHRGRVAFYERHGFTVTRRQPKWSPLPIRMNRSHHRNGAGLADLRRTFHRADYGELDHHE